MRERLRPHCLLAICEGMPAIDYRRFHRSSTLVAMQAMTLIDARRRAPAHAARRACSIRAIDKWRIAMKIGDDQWPSIQAYSAQMRC